MQWPSHRLFSKEAAVTIYMERCMAAMAINGFGNKKIAPSRTIINNKI